MIGLSDLPPELLKIVFGHLDQDDLLSVTEVCLQFNGKFLNFPISLEVTKIFLCRNCFDERRSDQEADADCEIPQRFATHR
jgi:F-box-like